MMSRSFQSRYLILEMSFRMIYMGPPFPLPCFLISTLPPSSLVCPSLIPLPSPSLPLYLPASHPSFLLFLLPPSPPTPSLFQFPLPEVVVIHRDPSCHEDLRHLKNYILEVCTCLSSPNIILKLQLEDSSSHTSQHTQSASIYPMR